MILDFEYKSTLKYYSDVLIPFFLEILTNDEAIIKIAQATHTQTNEQVVFCHRLDGQIVVEKFTAMQLRDYPYIAPECFRLDFFGSLRISDIVFIINAEIARMEHVIDLTYGNRKNK